MSTQVTPKFEGGKNIAMKLPSHLFNETVTFYRDVVRLPIIEEADNSVVFEFGGKKLWLDSVAHLNKAEIWLEIISEDVDTAEAYLYSNGFVRKDEIEPLPKGFKGFWIRNPADVVHLVSQTEE